MSDDDPWHLGHCKEEYTPNRRGFDHFYGFYTAKEDHFRHTLDLAVIVIAQTISTTDLAVTVMAQTSITTDLAVIVMAVISMAVTLVMAYLFSNKVIKYVKNHDKRTPMFMYFALQSVHGPLEAPQKYLDMYSHINDTGRRIKLAMVTAMDDAVAAVVEAFKEYGFWEDTLLIFMSDNGGPANGDNAGSNWPLRGSKHTLWEGGTRVVTLVHGKMLEKTGYENDQLIHIVDWYPTLVNLVGGETDPDMDGLDVWNTISKGDPSPRTDLFTISTTWKQFPLGPSDDPTERIDLSAEMPEKVDKMMARLRELEEEAVPAIDLPSMNESSPKYFNNVYSPGWC
ncbi:arylsulfatase B-like [Ptychodera flava]|uniref:arylsulfatase B-like n=1 Tax=Ptychodera flava TaxID=63121 RepID=UPI00396A2C01